MTKTRAWVLDHLVPPRLTTRLRAQRSNGRHLTSLIPEGRVAIDAGANIGLYTYWIAQRASLVHAFEPQPHLYAKLAGGSPRNVKAYQLALSDAPGTATLHVPEGSDGEGSLSTLDVPTADVEVRLDVLDDIGIDDVGFFKIDVEGHEEAVLRGATQLIQNCHPTIYIEIEERHNPGGIERISNWLAGLGYDDALCDTIDGWQAVSDFDAVVHQAGEPLSPGYVNNFLFRHGPSEPLG